MKLGNKRDAILSFIEFSEYLREKARISSNKIVGGFDWQHIFTERPTVLEELTNDTSAVVLPLAHAALLRAESYAVELGLPGLSHEVLAAVFDDVVGEFEARLQEDLRQELETVEQRVDKSIAAGVLPETILKAMGSASGRKATLANMAAILSAHSSGVISEVERQVMETSARLANGS